MLREGLAYDDEALYFGTQSGSVWTSPRGGDEWTEAARDLPPILSVEAASVAVVLLPAVLAAEAGGQKRFEVAAAHRRGGSAATARRESPASTRPESYAA